MGTQRLSSIETKRFIFEPLSAFLEARDISLANRTVINDIAVIAILGTRSIGKTTLLKQLYDTAPDVSEYLDLSVSIRDSKFEEYFAACKASGKTRILLDEVCKIDKEYEADFVKAVKDYVPHMTFIITGSTQAVVSALSSKICMQRVWLGVWVVQWLILRVRFQARLYLYSRSICVKVEL